MQFEDFQSKWAFKLLQRYRDTYRMFNDDVQVNHICSCFCSLRVIDLFSISDSVRPQCPKQLKSVLMKIIFVVGNGLAYWGAFALLLDQVWLWENSSPCPCCSVVSLFVLKCKVLDFCCGGSTTS